MRTIERTNQFKRDFKRELTGRYRVVVEHELTEIIVQLALDEVLPLRCFEHPLIGNWNDHRDCHIRPDLILIYRKPDKNTL